MAQESDQLPYISYTFDLAGLDSAPEVAAIEQALTTVAGVRTRIVFPRHTAWISAPASVKPTDIVRIFADHGVTARMTESTEDRFTRNPRWRKRSGSSERRQRVQRPVDPAEDVLFTSRDLITLPRLAVAILLGLPVILMSGVPAWQFPGWQYVAVVVALPVVTWCAWPFHRALVGGVRRGLPALDGASAVAIIAAYVWSVGMLVFTPASEIGWTSEPTWFAIHQGTWEYGALFLDVACGMTILLLLGRTLTMRTRTSLLDRIDENKPDPNQEMRVARRGRDDELLPLLEINVGDEVYVHKDALIPVDGVVVGGTATVAPGVVGEQRAPFKVREGDSVFAGSRVQRGRIQVRVLRTGHATRMAATRRWVETAATQQNKATMLSTRTAALLIPTAITLAVVDFLVWWLISGNPNAAFTSALAILASVAPVALALSTALAVRHGIESAARHGMMLRDGRTLRQLSAVDTIMFNRQGTLTDDHMTVQSVTAAEGEDEEEILWIAGALVEHSEHPASQAVVRAARESREQGLSPEHTLEVTHLEVSEDGAFIGTVEFTQEDKQRQIRARVWRPRTMSEVPAGRLTKALASGGTPFVVTWQGLDRGVIVLNDEIRAGGPEAVDELEALGVDTVMLSRDVYPVARRFADRLGINYVLAGIAPDDKARAVRTTRARGSTVALVGDDNLLDTLPAADVGILMGVTDTLSQVHRKREYDIDVVLLRPDIRAVPQMLALARRVCRVIDYNILWSWIYNVVALILAVAGLLHPMGATVLMLGSSLLIEARSHRVRNF